MLYPFKFEPVYKESIWGGESFKELFNKDVPFSHTGESWVVACHNHGMSIISNGQLKGKSLQYVFEKHKRELLGECYHDVCTFPLMIKFIDARDRLSLQVHPGDDYAKENECGESGKCELWYVLKAGKGAKVIAGLKDGITKEQFESGINAGNIESYVNEISVKAGDVISIPSGLIHAIEKDIVLFEVQQNSDIVYRVFDWNRLGSNGYPRKLHVKQALDVIDFKGKLKKSIPKGLSIAKNGNTVTFYAANRYFGIEKYSISSPLQEHTSDKMLIFTCIAGSILFLWGDTKLNIENGESILLPASIGEFRVEGKGELLKCFIPDIEKDFLQPLRDAGFSESAIAEYVTLNNDC
jgi:mannose-6-phosphate isomerase